jgi:hypothetical protein
MVEELVREFVPEALAAGLDFSGLQRVNPKFQSPDRDPRTDRPIAGFSPVGGQGGIGHLLRFGLGITDEAVHPQVGNELMATFALPMNDSIARPAALFTTSWQARGPN